MHLGSGAAPVRGATSVRPTLDGSVLVAIVNSVLDANLINLHQCSRILNMMSKAGRSGSGPAICASII